MPYYGAEQDYPPPGRPHGTCDWGHCDADVVAWRWDPDSRRFLPVCEQHRSWATEIRVPR
jgi:hypothetical protein